jgi:hypothetical protein
MPIDVSCSNHSQQTLDSIFIVLAPSAALSWPAADVVLEQEASHQLFKALKYAQQSIRSVNCAYFSILSCPDLSVRFSFSPFPVLWYILGPFLQFQPSHIIYYPIC